MKMIFYFIVLLAFISCNKDDNSTPINPTPNVIYTTMQYDDNISSPFGNLPYRIYFPKELTSQTQAIIVSYGGNGAGDDRGKFYYYINEFVKKGYVVVQIEHRDAGSNFLTISQYRGQEVKFISEKIKNGQLNYGSFTGSIDGSKQGYFGHSAGCMEGLLAAGLNMTHGNYLAPEIKAVYGMSGTGYSPDVWGITQTPNGFSFIGNTAIFLITGEQEKDSNGPGTVSQIDWRLQGYGQMNESGLRVQVLAKGQNTTHEDIGGLNADIKNYSVANALALFDTYLKNIDRKNEIGTLSKPTNNELVITKKGN
jgi:hypothetical protein